MGYLKTYFCVITVITALLTGCGFELRGPYEIPPAMQLLRIVPDDPFDPFQRVLRYNLKKLGLQVIEEGQVGTDLGKQASVLTILSQSLADRTTGYGPDVQINRTMKQFSLRYQVTDNNCKILIPAAEIQVERELTVNPNAVLGTQFEGNLIRDDLFQDAVLQLMRQLSNSACYISNNACPP